MAKNRNKGGDPVDQGPMGKGYDPDFSSEDRERGNNAREERGERDPVGSGKGMTPAGDGKIRNGNHSW